MRKLHKMITIIAVVLISCTANAQVSINTDGSDPDGSAMLDVKSANKGVLIPQVALSGVNDASTILTPATSLLVYNTATVTGLTPGYCYNSGTTGAPVWTRLVSGVVDGSETKVTAGTNVTLSGTGTNANPYVVGISNGTVAGQMQYWDGTAWVTVTPGTTGQTLTYCNGVPTWGWGACISIGDSYQGGIVFYILQSGDPGYSATVQHGLIAATADQGTSNTWWNGSYTTTGATGTALGTGSANTTTIITNQGNTGTYAAKICRDYTGGGYNDWYLPSKDELNKLYINRAVVGGFSSSYYYCSSEFNNTSAFVQYFNDGLQVANGKQDPTYVRAVRAF